MIAATGGGLPPQTTARFCFINQPFCFTNQPFCFKFQISNKKPIMQITVLAIANFTASCGRIEAGETVAVIVTDQPLSVTRDVLSLVRSGENYEMETNLEVGEIQSLLRRQEMVYCESDDQNFEADRDPEAVEQVIAEQQAETKPAPRPRRRKPATAE